MTNVPLPPVDQLTARSRAYGLLAALWRHGVTPELRAYITGLPALEAALPTPYSPDSAAAEHYALLGLTVFPYASAFLDEAGQVGGAWSAQAAAAYVACGFRPSPADAPDHVATELDALAFLVGAEADAVTDGLTHVATHMRSLQCDFLRTQLTPWLQPFLLAVDLAELPFYRALADLTRRVVCAHMDVCAVAAPSAPVAESAVTSPPPDPAAAATTLRDLVDFLMTPARAGVFITRTDLRTLAHAHATPAGFGDRRQTLLNLFRSAAVYEQLPGLLADVRALVLRWQAHYATAPHAAEAAAYAHLSAPWLPRVEQTLGLVTQMAALVQTATPHWSHAPSADGN